MKKIIFLLVSLCIMQTNSASIISFDAIMEGKNNKDQIQTLLNFISKSENPVILKFYADWCAPCRRISPLLHKASEQFSNRIMIITINTDFYDALSNFFSVKYLPTLVYFKGGKEVQRTNSVDQKTLISIIERLC